LTVGTMPFTWNFDHFFEVFEGQCPPPHVWRLLIPYQFSLFHYRGVFPILCAQSRGRVDMVRGSYGIPPFSMVHLQRR
jgi:hypothetical protein